MMVDTDRAKAHETWAALVGPRDRACLCSRSTHVKSHCAPTSLWRSLLNITKVCDVVIERVSSAKAAHAARTPSALQFVQSQLLLFTAACDGDMVLARPLATVCRGGRGFAEHVEKPNWHEEHGAPRQINRRAGVKRGHRAGAPACKASGSIARAWRKCAVHGHATRTACSRLYIEPAAER